MTGTPRRTTRFRIVSPGLPCGPLAYSLLRALPVGPRAHASLVRPGISEPSYSVSRRIFFRFLLRARACLARRLSPGFK